MPIEQSILALAEQAWAGELDLTHEHHPVHATVVEPEEILPGVLALKSLAGSYVVDTGAGLVLLDATLAIMGPSLYDAVRHWRPDAPLVAAVFSHHHVDHIFGVDVFDAEAAERGWARPVVYGHHRMPEHFDRYRRTLGWNTAINRRQFAIDIETFQWPEHYRYPDVTFDDRLSFRVGDLTFELHCARGETDDHVWTHIPERNIITPGDLFIWAVPNAGNPQKVQRYVSDWATALREMDGLGAATLLPGHGYPIFGPDRVHEALTTTAQFLSSIEDQTLAMMNKGWPLDRILHGVIYDQELMAKPWLGPVYDDPSFLVRMVWRRYGGWWDGEFDRLLPAPHAEVAAEWLDLAGGSDAVLERVASLVAEGRIAVACHLVEAAFHAEPHNAAVHAARAEAYRAHSAAQSSSMGRNILDHAARASDQGRWDLAAETDAS